MRENRLAKLAGLKKMAKTLEEYKSEAEIALSKALDASKTSRIGTARTETPGSILSKITQEKQSMFAAGKDFNYIASTFSNLGFDLGVIGGKLPSDDELGLGGSTLKATWSYSDDVDVSNWLALTSLKQGYSYGSKQTPAELAAQKRAPSGAQQGTRAPVRPSTIAHAVGTKLKDDNYEYEIMDQNGSFEWINLKDRSKHGTFSLSQSGIPKWNKAVAALNALPPQTSPVASAVPAAPVAPATPAATPATTTAQEASFDPTLVSNVSIILGNASNRAYALFIPGNQKQQLTTMFKAINAAAESLGINGVINPSQFLAKIIIAQSGPESLAGIGAIPSISSLRQGQIKRKVGEEVARLMSEVNKTYESYGGDNFEKMQNSFSSKMKKVEASPSTTTTPPTTTPAPAAPAGSAGSAADDGQDKKASLNKKFIKAATLRRLKIRSQMEAAIDSSAQMGRARVS